MLASVVPHWREVCWPNNSSLEHRARQRSGERSDGQRGQNTRTAGLPDITVHARGWNTPPAITQAANNPTAGSLASQAPFLLLRTFSPAAWSPRAKSPPSPAR